MAEPVVDRIAIELDPTHNSTSLERIVELTLLADLTQEAWFGRGQLVDVMHSSVDAFGHDVVLECGSVLRHVQLKARSLTGKTSTYKINTRLGDRPSGCVIWIGWQKQPNANRIDMQYRWFGGQPGARLPDLGSTAAKHTKANAQGLKGERPNLRVVSLSCFERLSGLPQLLDRLFGPHPSGSS